MSDSASCNTTISKRRNTFSFYYLGDVINPRIGRVSLKEEPKAKYIMISGPGVREDLSDRNSLLYPGSAFSEANIRWHLY